MPPRDRGHDRFHAPYVPPKSRDLVLQAQCFEDLHYWVREDAAIAEKILALVDDIRREPFSGIGKPEPLKHELRGYWSRRITGEHRLVYKVTDTEIRLVSARYHY